MSRTFSGGGYSVTINDDRSIVNPSHLVWLLHSALPAGVIVLSGLNASVPGTAVPPTGMMYGRRYCSV